MRSSDFSQLKCVEISSALAMCDNGSDSATTSNSGSASEQELDSRSSQRESVERLA